MMNQIKRRRSFCFTSIIAFGFSACCGGQSIDIPRGDASLAWSAAVENVKITDWAVAPSSNGGLLLAYQQELRDENGRYSGSRVFECLEVKADGTKAAWLKLKKNDPAVPENFSDSLPRPRGLAAVSGCEALLLSADAYDGPWLHRINADGSVTIVSDIGAGIENLSKNVKSSKSGRKLLSPIKLSDLVPVEGNQYLLLGWESKIKGKGWDALAAKIDLSGSVRWSRSYDLSLYDRMLSVVSAGDSYVFSCNAGDLEFANSGQISDVKILKCDQDGNLVDSETFPGRNALLAATGNRVVAVYDKSHESNVRDVWFREILSAESNAVEIAVHKSHEGFRFGVFRAASLCSGIYLIAGVVPAVPQRNDLDYNLLLVAYSADGQTLWHWSMPVRPAVADSIRLIVSGNRAYICWHTALEGRDCTGLVIYALDMHLQGE